MENYKKPIVISTESKHAFPAVVAAGIAYGMFGPRHVQITGKCVIQDRKS